MRTTSPLASAIVALILTPLSNFASPLDFDGDGRSDIVAYEDQADGSANEYKYGIMLSSTGGTDYLEFGSSGDLPASGDYDGDGVTEFAVVRVEADNSLAWRTRSATGVINTQLFGQKGDLIVAGCDFDHDGITDRSLVRDGDTWIILRSSDATEIQVALGVAGLELFYCGVVGAGQAAALIAQRPLHSKKSQIYAFLIDGTKVIDKQFGKNVTRIFSADTDGDGVEEIGYSRPLGKKERLVFSTTGANKNYTVKQYSGITFGRYLGDQGAADGVLIKISKNDRFINYPSLAVAGGQEIVIDDTAMLLSAVNVGQAGGGMSSEACDEHHNPRDGIGRDFLWKAVSDTTGNAVLLLPVGIHLKKVRIVKNGVVLEKLGFGGNGNGNRDHWRSNRRATTFPPNVTIIGQKSGKKHCWLIPNPSENRID